MDLYAALQPACARLECHRLFKPGDTGYPCVDCDELPTFEGKYLCPPHAYCGYTCRWMDAASHRAVCQQRNREKAARRLALLCCDWISIINHIDFDLDVTGLHGEWSDLHRNIILVMHVQFTEPRGKQPSFPRDFPEELKERAYNFETCENAVLVLTSFLKYVQQGIGIEISEICVRPHIESPIRFEYSPANGEPHNHAGVHVYLAARTDAAYDPDTPASKYPSTGVAIDPTFRQFAYTHGITDISEYQQDKTLLLFGVSPLGKAYNEHLKKWKEDWEEHVDDHLATMALSKALWPVMKQLGGRKYIFYECGHPDFCAIRYRLSENVRDQLSKLRTESDAIYRWATDKSSQTVQDELSRQVESWRRVP